MRYASCHEVVSSELCRGRRRRDPADCPILRDCRITYWLPVGKCRGQLSPDCVETIDCPTPPSHARTVCLRNLQNYALCKPIGTPEPDAVPGLPAVNEAAYPRRRPRCEAVRPPRPRQSTRLPLRVDRMTGACPIVPDCPDCPTRPYVDPAKPPDCLTRPYVDPAKPPETVDSTIVVEMRDCRDRRRVRLPGLLLSQSPSSLPRVPRRCPLPGRPY